MSHLKRYDYIAISFIAACALTQAAVLAGTDGIKSRAEEGSPVGVLPSGVATADQIPAQQTRSVTPQNSLAESIQTTLSELEGKLFPATYSKNAFEQRVVRLEQFVFGGAKKGSTIERLERLEKVLAQPSEKYTSEQNPESSKDGGGVSLHPTAHSTCPIVVSNDGSVATISEEKPTKSLIVVINQGIDHYNAHDYQAAEDDFEMCCALAPGMSRVHAYLAITRLQINDRKTALEEFRNAFALDPFGAYGRYAKYCLIKLAGDEAIRKHGPVDPKVMLDGALNKIDEQSSTEIARHRELGERSAQAHLRAARVSSNYLSGGPAARFSSSYVAAARASEDATLRGAFTQESANNLKLLLATKQMPGDAHLRAWGTNLHTRYYGSDTRLYPPHYIPREYVAPLKAVTQSFGPAPKLVPKSAKSATNLLQRSRARRSAR